LGYNNSNNVLIASPLTKIMKKSENIIKSSYSVKCIFLFYKKIRFWNYRW